mmetsp:Transcript_33495/g.75810  ORF Transcript_33495/g.75810 Transcript_33495/m.75810 type:complete len:169 (+) Transcript_33495:59-565(+)
MGPWLRLVGAALAASLVMAMAAPLTAHEATEGKSDSEVRPAGSMMRRSPKDTKASHRSVSLDAAGVLQEEDEQEENEEGEKSEEEQVNANYNPPQYACARCWTCNQPQSDDPRWQCICASASEWKLSKVTQREVNTYCNQQACSHVATAECQEFDRSVCSCDARGDWK